MPGAQAVLLLLTLKNVCLEAITVTIRPESMPSGQMGMIMEINKTQQTKDWAAKRNVGDVWKGNSRVSSKNQQSLQGNKCNEKRKEERKCNE